MKQGVESVVERQTPAEQVFSQHMLSDWQTLSLSRQEASLLPLSSSSLLPLSSSSLSRHGTELGLGHPLAVVLEGSSM